VKSLSVRNIQRQEGTIFVTFQALEAHEVKPGVIWMSSNRWHCIDCGASSNGLKILLIIVPDRETGTYLLSYISLDDQESTQELRAGKTGDYY
jgi:quercetin dioxygenase-like cupin family protein